MIPLVTIDEFELIECSQCGECCEGFTCAPPWDLPGRYNEPTVPRTGEQSAAQYDSNRRQGRWETQALIPISSLPEFETGRFRYRCRFFERQDANRGTCRVYEGRPWTCSAFPYDRPDSHPSCTWNVEIDHAVWDGTT